MISKKIAITPRWSGPIPTTRDGKPLPMNQWARKGRRRTWCVRWYAPDGSRPRKTFKSKADADDFANAKAVSFDQHGETARLRIPRRTLGTFADDFEKLRIGPRGQRLGIETLNEYMRVLRDFASHVGEGRTLESIAPADVTGYFAMLRTRKSDRLGKPISTCSVNKHKRGLKTVFNVAIKQCGLLRANPCSAVREDKVADQAVRYVTPAEFSRIVEACRTLPVSAKRLWWEAFVTLAYTAATRVNEAVHLCWINIDFSEPQVQVVAKPETDFTLAWQPKDFELRTVPVPEETISLLARMQSDAPEGAAYAFLSPTRLAWIKAKQAAGAWKEDTDALNNVDRDFKRIAKAAEVSDVSMHDLRRACITHWARELPAHVAKDLAGHSSITTTLRYYVSVQDEDRQKARSATAKALPIDPK